MSPREELPDVDRLARSMLMLHGDHDCHDERVPAAGGQGGGSWSKASAFADDPERAAAVREATQADRTRYLTSSYSRWTAGFAMPRSTSNGRDRGIPRCNGTPKPPSAAPISRSYAPPVSTARAPERVPSSPTASNTPWPRAVWTRCPPPHQQATASRLQSGEALLDFLGG